MKTKLDKFDEEINDLYDQLKAIYTQKDEARENYYKEKYEYEVEQNTV